MNDNFPDQDDFLRQLSGLEPAKAEVDSAEVFYAAGFRAAESGQQPATFNGLAIGLLAAVVMLMLAIPVSYHVGYALASDRNPSAVQKSGNDVSVEGVSGAKPQAGSSQHQPADTLENEIVEPELSPQVFDVLASNVFDSMAKRLLNNLRMEQFQAHTLTAFHGSLIDDHVDPEEWINRLPGGNTMQISHNSSERKTLALGDAMEFQVFSSTGVQR